MSIFSHGEFTSEAYRWRKDGKILVTVISQSFCLGDTEKEKIKQDIGKEKKSDIDAVYLEKFFKGKQIKFPVGTVDYVIDRNLKYDEFLESRVHVMKKEHEKYEKYDCFIFIFLTFVGKESAADDKLHFFDQFKPLGEILDDIKKQEVTLGKPKVFLIQSDDKTLLEPKTWKKGPTPVMERKIPQDADRLIIQSTIPQRIFNNGRKPSFLVRAFIEAMEKNSSGQKDDFLSLTTTINGIVHNLINISEGDRKDDLSIPLVTSTFTKLLLL